MLDLFVKLVGSDSTHISRLTAEKTHGRRRDEST